MRVYGPNGTALAAAPASKRRAASGGFSVSEGEEAPHNAGAAGPLRAVATVDALIALQGVENPTERKKRAVNKGRHALDLLEAFKLGLLDGNVDPSMLSRLKVAADGLNGGSGDPSLDAVLGEIDLRLAVELAKAGVR